MRPTRQIIGSAALALFALTSYDCHAQSNTQTVKQEPFDGQMAPGSILLVDDGSCGKGRIKEVTGGEVAAMNPRPRTRRCIPKVMK